MGLMTAGLPLMKGALTSPAKSVLLLCYNLDYQQQHQQDMQLFKKNIMDQVVLWTYLHVQQHS